MRTGRALVGRRAELAAMVNALKRADTAGAVVIGEAGVGKTKLIDATLEVAADAGFVTTRIRGDRALTDLPLAAFAPLLSDRPAGDAGDLVALRNALATMAAGRPLLLAVDDAHYLDDTSAVLVHQLAAELTAFVIVGLRTGVRPPAAITALWKERLAVRVDLGPLQRSEIADLLGLTVGVAPAASLEVELWQRSGGNPLFALELMVAAREAGTLVERDGLLTLDGALPAPTSLTELLGVRLSSLDEQEWRAASLLAIAGSLPVEVLERLVEPDALVRLEAARLITADERGDRLEVRFAHPLHAEAVRQELGLLAARQLRRDLADVLQSTGDETDDNVLRVATLRIEGGGSSPTELLIRATRLARRRHDPALAERLARATVDQAPTIGSGLAVANTLWEQGRPDEAARALADPRVDWSAASPSEQAAIAGVSASVLFWGLGEASEALARLHAAATVASDDRVPHILGDAAAIEAARGRPGAALGIAPRGSPAARTALGLFAVVTALTSAGRPMTAIDDMALPPAGASGPWQFAGMAYGFALVDAGRIAEASELAFERIDAAVRAGSRHARCCWTIVLADAEMMLGRTEGARQWYGQAAQLAFGAPGGIYLRRWALSGAMFCAALLGDLDDAAEQSRSLDSTPAHDAVVHEQPRQLAEQWIVAQRGDPAGAARALRSMADVAYEAGRYGDVVRALLDATRLIGDARPAAAWLEHHDLDVDGGLFPAVIDWIIALDRRDDDALAAIAERFLLEADVSVLAAEAASSSWTIARERGAPERLVAARGRRAQELRAMFGPGLTPSLAVTPIDLPLSGREREIATLVASGRTSREVAEELVIGVRTVESHLARIYGKLGIRSRVELANALGLEAAQT